MSVKKEYTPALRPTGMPWDRLYSWVTGELEEKPFRARQLFSWIHLRGVESFEAMTDLPASFRGRLRDSAALTVLKTLETSRGDDGAEKFLLELPDGLPVESVLIPDPPRLTACLSSQVGCRMGCAFCMTGIAGFRRNLEPDEIVAQLYALRRVSQERITNAVLMGMGEPLDNLDRVLPALDIISHEHGICLGQRKITISTIGLPRGIARLAELGRQYGLAVSLHSAVRETRERLVPASAAVPLETLRESLLGWAGAVGRRATLEYCLIEGVNDSIREARALSEFARGLPCKINLLLYNPVPGLPWKRPGDRSVKGFMDYLYPRCPAVTLRRSRGADVQGACGQLGASLLLAGG
jgi:23S rRNA (adenine2503-C2)-methyltransferase